MTTEMICQFCGYECKEHPAENCDDCFLGLQLRDGMAWYCGTKCLLSALEKLGDDQIKRVPFKKLNRWQSTCYECNLGEERQPNNDPDVLKLQARAEKLKVAAKKIAARAKQLRKQAKKLIEERDPVVQTKFVMMEGGYGPPIDPDGQFCSVECVRSFFMKHPYNARNS